MLFICLNIFRIQNLLFGDKVTRKIKKYNFQKLEKEINKQNSAFLKLEKNVKSNFCFLTIKKKISYRILLSRD